jgi:hypothetical protein
MFSQNRVLTTEWILVIQAVVTESAGYCRRNERWRARLQVLDTSSDRRHIAGDLTAWDDRQGKRIAVDSTSHPEIQMVQATGADPYHDLSRLSRRYWQLYPFEHLRSTVARYSIGSHPRSLSSVEQIWAIRLVVVVY